MPTDASTLAPAENRRLAAIMFSDMVGFSRQMGANEARMMRMLEVHNALIQRAVAEHHGHVIKTLGDAFVVDFPSVVNAVQCAQRILVELRRRNAMTLPEERINLRIGIHLDDIIQLEGDVFGDGVNIASRLQTLAEPDTICISHAVYQEVEKKLSLGAVVPLGCPKLKNIARRIPVYALLHEPPCGICAQLRWRWLTAFHSGLAFRVSAAVLVLVFGLLAAVVAQQIYNPALHQHGIVVLPFDNWSKDPSQEYFSDGISEDLTTELSKIPSLFVISRNSAFTYKGKIPDVRVVGREMRVRYVLEGSVQRMGNKLRITAQLIDASTNGHLWADMYDRKQEDLFGVQDEIVKKIVTTLRLQLDRGALIGRTTDNIEAYDWWLRGMDSLNKFGPKANLEARKFFEKAIEVDPTYADAYARLSWTYWLAWFWYQGTDKDLEKSRELADKAIELNDALPIAHASRGWIYLFKKEHDKAIAEAQRAIAVDPNFAGGYHALSDMLCFAGRGKESLAQMEMAMSLNPRFPVGYLNSQGFALIAIKRHQQGIAALQAALKRNSDFLAAHVNLAVAYHEVGRHEEAKAEVVEFLRLSPTASVASVRRKIPFKNAAEVDRWVNALRAAGLPEVPRKVDPVPAPAK